MIIRKLKPGRVYELRMRMGKFDKVAGAVLVHCRWVERRDLRERVP